MALFELDDFTETAAVPSGFGRLIEMIRHWHLRRQTVAQLSRLDPHLRRDAGFEPADAYDPLNGGLEALWKQAHRGPDLPNN